MEMEWREEEGAQQVRVVRLEVRSMAAAILSRLEEMRPRGRSNIATWPRRAFITLPHPGQLPLACARKIRCHNSNPPWNKRACS